YKGKLIIAIAIITAANQTSDFSAATWVGNNPTDQRWTTLTNWQFNTPPVSGDFVTIGVSGGVQTLMNTNENLTGFTFNFSTGSGTLLGDSVHTLTLNNGASAANINITLGNYTFAGGNSTVAMILGSDLNVTVTSTGQVFTIAGSVGGTGNITKAGNGT